MAVISQLMLIHSMGKLHQAIRSVFILIIHQQKDFVAFLAQLIKVFLVYTAQSGMAGVGRLTGVL